MAKRLLIIVLLIIFITSTITLSQQYKKPKNVIFLIADGGGFNHILATDYYQYGKTGEQSYQKFPVHLAVSTYPAKSGSYPNKLKYSSGYDPSKAWESYSYLQEGYTESAAAATALGTGIKTYNNSIGMDIYYKPLKNLTEIAKEYNKSTGVITSVPISHATPAGFSAHNLSRANYSEIAKELIFKSRLDVIMGTGNPYFDNDGKGLIVPKSFQFVGDSLTFEFLKSGKTNFQINDSVVSVQDCNGDNKPDAWKLIQTQNEFQNLVNGKTPARVLGLPQVYQTLQQGRSGDAKADPYIVPFNKNVPNLAEMVLGGLNVLDNNRHGFFLMVEGGAVDWAAHSNQTGRTIEEMIDFNKAVDTIVYWVEKNSNWNETLLIVTADHETGLLWGPFIDDGEKYFNPIINNGKGSVPALVWNSGDHTNSLVPFFAKGAGSEIFNLFADEFDPIRGKFLNNTEIAQAIRILWNK